MHKEFTVHMLNENGKAKAHGIAMAFDSLLTDLEKNYCGSDGRHFAVVRTKLEEAAFFAKKAMAVRHENQEKTPLEEFLAENDAGASF